MELRVEPQLVTREINAVLKIIFMDAIEIPLFEEPSGKMQRVRQPDHAHNTCSVFSRNNGHLQMQLKDLELYPAVALGQVLDRGTPVWSHLSHFSPPVIGSLSRSDLAFSRQRTGDLRLALTFLTLTHK